MRLLLDEMIDERLSPHFKAAGHHCSTARASGFKGLLNGYLLAAADARGFDVLITTDKNIQYQNNLTGKRISVLIIRVFRNKLTSVLPHIPEALRAIDSLTPGVVRYVGEPSLVAKHKS